MRSIPTKESLTVEFKSDSPPLSDRELVNAVVCLANTDGGAIYLGVEDDGTVSGLHKNHTNLTMLAALVANRTNPPISVRVSLIEEEGKQIAEIKVPRYTRLVSTSEGLLQRRRIQANGQPECVPFYPHEFIRRQADIGILDYTSMPLMEATVEDFDPLERERLRQMIERYRGDRTLISLTNEELDGALGLVSREGGALVPTVAGILLLGRQIALRRMIPTHEVAFQVLEGTQIRVNDFFKTPLLKSFETIMELFKVRNEEDEINVGLFRIPIPNFEERSFREAFVNAIIHRDYTQLGAVHVRRESNGITISNPGGFVEGVTIANLLVVEPRPRNPLLADIVKRIGLCERTGRGVDLIYEGLLRYGRPAPDYTRSDSKNVVVNLSSAKPDIPFLKMIIEEEERTKMPTSFDSLIILSQLRHIRRMTIQEAAQSIQKDELTARNVLERLVESALVDAHGVSKGRLYTLSAKVYSLSKQKSDYIRQSGFDSIQQEQMVMSFVQKHGLIKRQEVVDLCKISPDQASRLLKNLTKQGLLIKSGQNKLTTYKKA